MSSRALGTVFLLALLAVSPRALAADAGDDGGDAATDASTADASASDASVTDAAIKDAAADAALDAPVSTSDSGPITFRPDSGEEDAGTAVTPTPDDGGCNASGGDASSVLALGVGAIALLRRLRAR